MFQCLSRSQRKCSRKSSHEDHFFANTTPAFIAQEKSVTRRGWKDGYAKDLKEEAFKEASVLNLCSGTLFQPKALETSRKAVEYAKKHGALLSFDANIRPLRWDSESECRETIKSFFKDADLLKFTEEELTFLT
ncbi:hypothetical protein JQK62_18080, partial [Leptospira santarosai]|nr:hypothetical protein [Leptospira santarosai]